MSRLRRDRHALKVARYVKRTDCREYTGVGRWGMASYRAMGWLAQRRVRGTAADHVRLDQQLLHVNRLFGVREL